jgi:hypothetical protein
MRRDRAVAMTLDLDRRTLLRGAAAGALLQPWRAGAATTVQPLGAAGHYDVVANWTFGAGRADATIGDHAALRRAFRFRYIYDQGRLDHLPSYWSVHRDYAANDPRNLHVFTHDALILKARIPPGGGLRPGGIESGMLRALLPVTPGMYVEMRAKLPRGLGVWPAFWLNPGVEYPDGHFSATPWPPEIDIFEFFVWQGRTEPRIMESHIQTAGKPQDFGDPHDIFTLYGPHGYEPGFDFSRDYHVFALDWQDGAPIWLLDGKRIKQTVYAWHAPPAHILVTNQIGMSLPGVNLQGMVARPEDWDYAVDYLRVFRKS